MKIKKSLLKFISPETDPKERLNSAIRVGEDFLALPPSDQVTVLFVLSHDNNDNVAAAADETLEGAEEPFILKALGQRLNGFVLRDLFVRFCDNASVLRAILGNKGLDDSLARTITKSGSQDILDALEKDLSIIKRVPSIIDSVKENPLAGADLIEKLESAARELTGAPTSDETTTTLEEEKVSDLISEGDDFDSDRFNVYQAICNMTAGEKIKLAHTGDRSVRNLLIKDKNRVVALSVMKNPKLTEQEVVRVASSTNTSEEILRDITNSREWMKSYNIKTAIVQNARTPLASSLKLVDYLRERDLKNLARNKGIPGALKSAAERKLQLKTRR